MHRGHGARISLWLRSGGLPAFMESVERSVTPGRSRGVNRPDVQLLALLAAKYAEPFGRLTPAERREVIHIAQGFACKDSATVDERALETIRSRRKRLYGKLRVSGSGELLSSLLALSLEMLARGERLVEPVPSAGIAEVAGAEDDAGAAHPRVP